MLVQSKRCRNRGPAFDDEIVEFWIDLPSGRRLDLGYQTACDYDSDAETDRRAAEYRAEIASMVAELNAMKK